MATLIDASRAALRLLRRKSNSIADTVAWGRESNRVEQMLIAALAAEGERKIDRRQEEAMAGAVQIVRRAREGAAG